MRLPRLSTRAAFLRFRPRDAAGTRERLSWSAEEVDAQLHNIMKNIYAASVQAAEECGLGYNLVAGANVAGFKKVADAMMAQGLV